MALRVRAGLHLGLVERRDDDLFGSPVNRAARIMKAAHGGQILVSQAVVDRTRERLPDGASLRDLGAVRLRDLATSEHVYQLAAPRTAPGFSRAALARGDAQQPAAAGDVVHRARDRARRGEAAPRWNAAADAARHGRPRQDAAVAADRRRRAGPLSRRRVVRRPRADSRPVAGSERHRPRAGHPRGRRQAGHPEPVRAPARAHAADRARQLRAPGRRVRDSRRHAAQGDSRNPNPRDEPRGAAHPGGTDVSGAAAARARPQGRRRGAPALGRRAALRRAGAAAEAGLCSDGRRRSRGRASCALASTASRSRWSSRPRACARCRSPRSTRDCTTASSS